MYLEQLTTPFFNQEVQRYFLLCDQLTANLSVKYSGTTLFANLLISQVLTSPNRWKAFSFCLLLALFAFRLSQQNSKRLDETLSWISHFRRRLISQCLYGILLSSLFISAVTLFFCLLTELDLFDDAEQLKQVFTYGVITTVFVNLTYTTWFLYRFSGFALNIYIQESRKQSVIEDTKKKEEDRPKKATVYLSRLIVRFGFREEVLLTKNIMLLKASSSRRQCYVKNTRQAYDFDLNLEHLAMQLDPKQFYKVNRQYIVNREIISGYKAIGNGKIQLNFFDAFLNQMDIKVSREHAKYFKNWFDTGRDDTIKCL